MQAFSCSPDSLLMDLNCVTTDAVLKQTLERATVLPDAEKRAIIEVVDGYCMSVGLRQQFAPGNTNRLPLNLTWYRKPPTGVLDDKPDPDPGRGG